MVKIFYSMDNEPFLKNLKQELKNNFADCKTLAVKIHFGEPGNKTAFTPEQIKPITDILKELNLDFFLYDSSVAYPSPRGNPESHMKVAIERGWDKLGKIRTDDQDFIEVKTENLTYELCKPLTEVDAVLVISHVKGHVCSGFGAAIKNLGMGSLTKKTKSAIHAGGSVYFKGECTQCGVCADSCPINGIEVTDKPNFKLCFGCSNCIDVCPTKAIHFNKNYFDVLLAEGANVAQSKFKKYYYINIANNISRLCDCGADAKELIAKDTGFLSGKDAVAIDKASLDLISKNEGVNVFLKNNKKTGLQQINAAESFNMGSQDYELVEL